MHFLYILASLVLLWTPTGAQANWLQLDKSDAGYLFKGIAEGERFSFDIPGRSVRTSGDSGRAFAQIDDVLVQVMRAPLPAAPDDRVLDAHGASEVAYLRGAGAVVSESAVCGQLPIPHREWIATLPNGSTSTFLTIRIAHHVLVVVLAADAATTTIPVNAKLAALCASLKT